MACEGLWGGTDCVSFAGVTLSLSPDASCRTPRGRQVGHEGLFMAEGSTLLIDSYPVEKAVALSDSLFGRKIEVALSCEQEETVPAADSCVVFKLNFTNSR